MSTYEAPTVTELGSIADFTRGDGWAGNHDNFSWSGTFWGHEINIDIDYGSPTS